MLVPGCKIARLDLRFTSLENHLRKMIFLFPTAAIVLGVITLQLAKLFSASLRGLLCFKEATFVISFIGPYTKRYISPKCRN